METQNRPWNSASPRAPICAGDRGSYPETAPALREAIAELRVRYPDRAPVFSGDNVIAISTPHMDWSRGAPVYAQFSHVLKHLPRPDVVLMLGVAHRPVAGEYFYLPDKRYASPLGVCDFDEAALDQICSEYGEKILQRVELHDEEWSLELPLPFLQERWPEREMPTLIPLLVGSFEKFPRAKRDPLSEPSIAKMVTVLGSLLRSYRDRGVRVLVVSSVDMSHKGLFQGDLEVAFGRLENEIRAVDAELLDILERSDADAFREHLAVDGNQWNRDTFSPLYTQMRLLEAAGVNVSGRTVAYELHCRWLETEQGRCDDLVSFATGYWEAV